MSDFRPDFVGSGNDLITAITWVAERMRKRGLIVATFITRLPKSC